MLIDLGQRLAHEAGAVSHTKDQARGIGIREHYLHDLLASHLDEGDVLLLPPHQVRREIERRPMLDRIDDATHDAIHECGQDVALVREVLVQGAPRDERPPTDVGDGRLMEALAREHRERAVENLLPALVAWQIRAADRSRHAAPGTPLMSCVQRTYWLVGFQFSCHSTRCSAIEEGVVGRLDKCPPRPATSRETASTHSRWCVATGRSGSSVPSG